MENKLSTSLSGLNALICGSTSGIGKSTAQEFSLLGANVTLFSRNEEKLNTTLTSLVKSKNQHHQYLVGDFDNPNHIKGIIESHISSNVKYQILVNNSGGPEGGPIVSADISEFLNAFNRHLICNHILAQTVLPGMIDGNYGRIINIVSTSVKQPIEGLGVSNTIRGAVASWAKTLSFEVARNGITVNNVLPGFTDTERLSSLIQSKSLSQGKSEEEISIDMKQKIPSGRFGVPQEIAKAITFLASPSAGYINGVSLAVDGGRLSSI